MDQWPGLSRTEAADRLARFGPNSLPVPGYRLLRLILRQFAGVFNLLLLAALFLTVLALGLTLALPIIPVSAAFFEFKQPSLAHLGLIMAIAVLYLAANEIAKRPCPVS